MNGGTRTKLLDLSRDWRIRTLIPVLLINVVAFAGLYRLMRHFSLDNLVATQKFAAATLLDEIELGFQDKLHGARALEPQLRRQLEAHKLLTLNAYDANGIPIVESGRPITAAEVAQARIVLLQPAHPTMWLSEGKERVLYGVHALRNTDTCRACHAEQGVPLGAIQIGIDLTQPMAEATSRVHRAFAMAGAAWVMLLSLMFWAGGVVIGRPLRDIQKTLSETGESESANDLNALANRLHGRLWNLIEKQRERESDIQRHMARAEQLAALGELAAGLTHEIKNPLAGVIAALELFRDEVESPSQNHEVYEQMLAELRRVVGTLDSLLRLARPQPPHRADADLGRIAREVTSLFAARLRRQRIQLELDVAESLPALPLDAGLISQLLVNLLTNSMQACDRDARISVLVAPFPRHDGVVLAVTDTGKGIDREHLDRVFEPFFTTKEEGTGLGMAICRQIVEQHGGTIDIESEVGAGTKVVVLFPRQEEGGDRAQGIGHRQSVARAVAHGVGDA